MSVRSVWTQCRSFYNERNCVESGTYDCDGLGNNLGIRRTILVYVRDSDDIGGPSSNHDGGRKARRRPGLDGLISAPGRGAVAAGGQCQSADNLKVPERRVRNRICK